jgi:hypothetical protein
MSCLCDCTGFRWVVCQLAMLLRCFPASLRATLNTLPKTLDETYQCILLGIEEESSEYVHRFLQCLTVSFRPLRVEELAEVLTFITQIGAWRTFKRQCYLHAQA